MYVYLMWSYRVVATVKNSMVNMVCPILPIVEHPNYVSQILRGTRITLNYREIILNCM